MDDITKTELKKLAEIENDFCVSIYIPTYKVNEEGSGYDKNRMRFKNQLTEVETQMKKLQAKTATIESYLKKLEEYEMKTDFWANQSEGLACFYDGNEVKIYRVPKSFEPFVFVDRYYHLVPLSTSVSMKMDAYILRLSAKENALYSYSNNKMEKLNTDKVTPSNLEDAVGHQYEEKSLQAHSHEKLSGNEEAMFHGQGAGNESEKKSELLTYFREIDEGINKVLKEANRPLILACVDYLFPIYEEANSYAHLSKHFIKGNFDEEKEGEEKLKHKTQEILEELEESQRLNVFKSFKEKEASGNSSARLNDVLPASVAGRIDTLMVQSNKRLWGRYVEDKHQVEIKDERIIGDTDLMNMAVVETIKNDGRVIEISEENELLPDSELLAIYRYSLQEA